MELSSLRSENKSHGVFSYLTLYLLSYPSTSGGGGGRICTYDLQIPVKYLRASHRN